MGIEHVILGMRKLYPYQLKMLEGMAESMSMTIEQMKGKLLEWNPSWNLDRFTDQQIRAIYIKERSKTVEILMGMYQ